MTSDININGTVWLSYKQVAKARRSFTPTCLEKIYPVYQTLIHQEGPIYRKTDTIYR
jgi:hypothetical protein